MEVLVGGAPSQDRRALQRHQHRDTGGDQRWQMMHWRTAGGQAVNGFDTHVNCDDEQQRRIEAGDTGWCLSLVVAVTQMHGQTPRRDR